ncbi:hypothetical protein [Streptomyces lonarensis]|uniref:Uncharacterized protein n=1 Tax=Streptomyces lonarensis TaxID=700599 RepID=A0A7X6HYE2_9ACTN|nr:hypothetical protein [Streptomyces lonarensis]NJQ05488.1 hypothetical protein [Streptomyces lonarensis]
MHESTSRSSELRTTAVASAVALALALPLAFAKSTTQHVDSPAAPPPAAAGTESGATGEDKDGSPAQPGSGSEPAPGHGDRHGAPGGAPDGPDGADGADGADGPEHPGGASRAADTDCGPAISAPEGVEARTCLVTEGADTWARVYYRNGSGEPLRGELTVHDPAGGTVEVRCDVPATEARGVCETPRVPTVDDSTASFYSATAELTGPGADGALLRAASPRS